MDQSPIGRSVRSNPVTYIKAYDDIRKLIASARDAKTKGLKARDFSFNVDGGRCDVCKGTGTVVLEPNSVLPRYIAFSSKVCADASVVNSGEDTKRAKPVSAEHREFLRVIILFLF